MNSRRITRTKMILRGLNTIQSLLLLILLTSGSFLLRAQTMETAHIPTEGEIKKIIAAMPDKPRVKPKKNRKVLVFSMSHKYYHNCIPTSKKAFAIMGKKTGAFEVVVSDDITMFEPENLKTFDAIIFNNAYIEMFITYTNIAKGYFGALKEEDKKKAMELDQRLKNSLIEFIKEGKGLVVLHASVASFESWPEFGHIVGARFDGHPWKDIDVTFKVDRPKHPLTQAFKTTSFVLNDEIYQVKDPYSRDSLNVLVSIDATKTDMTRKGINRKDRDFGITWIKKYGKGRVFYCALGHKNELFWNSTILQHYLDGIQYVLGDLELDNENADRTICFGADFFYTKNHPDKSRIPFFFKEYKNAQKYQDILIAISTILKKEEIAALAYQNVIHFIQRLWKEDNDGTQKGRK